MEHYNIKTLIIGAGSIGLRHSEVLKKIGHKISFVSNRIDLKELIFFSIHEALKTFKPNYIVICRDTNKHISTLKEINDDSYNYKGKILVEKPVSVNIEAIEKINFSTNHIFIGYNLRFHPCIQKLKSILENEICLSASIYAGQFLPNWRPNRDYRLTYSSKKNKGGGVLLELSHELDYLLYLFGNCLNTVCWEKKLSNLDINCNDSAISLMEFEKCQFVSLNLNMIDKKSRRDIVINTQKNSYKIDLVNSIFETNDYKEIMENDKNISYNEMHKDILNKKRKISCSFNEGKNIMYLINKLQLNSDSHN